MRTPWGAARAGAPTAFDLVISEVNGIELEPDEKDGTFLD